MSEIKALENLRKSSHLDDSKWTLDSGEVVLVSGSDMEYPDAINWGEQWRKIADEIEAEIAERFCEIPVDSNGFPCKCGDEVRLTGEDERLMVCGYTVDTDGFVSLYCSKLKDGRRWFPTVMTFATEVEHVEPRTIEDVLEDFELNVLNYGREWELDDAQAAIAECAAEIRELLGVSE